MDQKNLEFPIAINVTTDLQTITNNNGTFGKWQAIANAVESINTKVTNSNASIQRFNNSIQNLIQTHAKEKNTHDDRIKASEKDRKERDERIKALEVVNAQYQGRIVELTKVNDTFDKKIDNLSKTINEYAQYKGQAEQLNDQVKRLTQEKVQQEILTSEHKKSTEQLTKHNKKLLAAVNEYDDRINQYEKYIQESKEQIDQLEQLKKQVELLNICNNKLEKNILDLKNQKNQGSDRIDNITKSYEALAISVLQSTVQNLRVISKSNIMINNSDVKDKIGVEFDNVINEFVDTNTVNRNLTSEERKNKSNEVEMLEKPSTEIYEESKISDASYSSPLTSLPKKRKSSVGTNEQNSESNTEENPSKLLRPNQFRRDFN